MPTRTKAARQLIDSLPKKAPTDKCNARTPSGYCRMPAGFRTSHPGNGRCYLHGGDAGAPVKTGIYSKKLRSRLAEEYNRVVTDPGLADLYSEAALSKLLLSNLLEKLSDRLEAGENVFVKTNRYGETVESPEMTMMLKLIETIGRNINRIAEAEKKAKHVLNIRQVNNILIQIKNTMGETCGECPIRKSVGERLREIKVEPVKPIE